MANNIQVNDTVYVCRNRLPALPDQGKAFYQAQVVARNARSVRVQLPNGDQSELVSTKFVHHRVGLAIIAFGDLMSESTLIDPLSKTVLQYSRLLFGDDDYTRFFKIRTEAELRELCRTNSFAPYDDITIIGHGSKEGEISGAIDKIPVANLKAAFETNNPRSWDFTFLCCYLGRNAFSQPFSKSPCCKSMVAPFNQVHGAVSAQFIQTYLVKCLLEGETTTVAHRHASESTPPTSGFRLWRNGARVA